MAAGDPLRRLGADLRNESQRVGKRAADITRKTGAAIVRRAKADAPYRDGDLRDSIEMSVTGDGRSGSMSIEIGPTERYGRYNELGTSRMAPQPFLFPAADSYEQAFVTGMAKAAEPKI